MSCLVENWFILSVLYQTILMMVNYYACLVATIRRKCSEERSFRDKASRGVFVLRRYQVLNLRNAGVKEDT